MRKSYWQALCSAPLFGGLTADEITGLQALQAAETETVEKGEIIYDPVSFRRSLAVILKGTALVTRGADDRSVIMSKLRAGDIFGMAALFGEAENFATNIRAQSQCVLLFIPRATLEALFREEPRLAANYIAILSERIRFLNRRIDELTINSATEKLLSYLTAAAVEENGILRVILPFGMTELARVLNVSRASLYRGLQSLCDEGVLRKDGKTITLCRQHQLGFSKQEERS